MKKTTPIPRIGLLSGLVLTALLIADGPSSAAADDAEGFVSIFDGRTLAGWEGDPEHWTVEDGAITGKATLARPMKTNNFIVWRQGDLDDFELRVEYRIDGGNSGIQYRSFEKPAEWPKWVVGGYQADVDATDKYTGILYGERYRGILSQRGEKTVIGDDHKPEVVGRVGDGDELKAAFRPGDWNHYRIVAHGYHFIHEINGRVMCEVTDEDQAERRRGGILALQLHAGADMKVQFRNLRLKRLPMQDGKKVVFVAGPVSHGYGEHEHYAGCLLLAKALNDNVPGVYATVYRDGWPADPTAFDNADAVVLFSDGGGGHPMLKHLEVMDKLARSGVGLACLHYAVEVPKGEAGDSFLRWIGGYFETFWSVNPWWTPDFKKFPDHPIARGVRPFSIEDEWYYHMRFGKDTAGVT
ncbi:MAG: DUF1080 domain-containing protein, partial [Planctomycetes bacterium]|nr:DUF1080 domain-containing protein [Planctomycetota bacterium]